jgi:hypothetical protein
MVTSSELISHINVVIYYQSWRAAASRGGRGEPSYRVTFDPVRRTGWPRILRTEGCRRRCARLAPFGRPEPATRELVDREVRRIVEDCYGQAVATLSEHRDRLDALARALLDRETLDEDDAYAAAGISPEPERPAGARRAALGQRESS